MGLAALPASRYGLAQPQKVHRVGYVVSDSDPRGSTTTFVPFAAALRERGWVEGKNLDLRVRSSRGNDALFPQLIADLLREQVSLIVTAGSPATRAAKAATDSVPIVFTSAANPVEQKLVASFGRPGGNVTGLALQSDEVGPKRVQLLKEMLPQARRFVRLYQGSTTSNQAASVAAYDAAARSLGVALDHVAVADMDGLDGALGTAARERADAVMLTAAGLFVGNRKAVAQLALQHRLPAMCPDARFTEAGALVSYGENMSARYRRAAVLVDKILRGMKPADIPVEQTAIFELVINLQTARHLGKSIPEPFLLQADRLLRG
jgi:putative ABC transport system substrate-binding protein